MSKKAIIRGEAHISNIDRKALLDRDLSDFQAAYFEGRSDTIVMDKYTYSYVLYLIGHLSLELFYITAAKFYNYVLPSPTYDVEQAARDEGLDVRNEIDLEIHEIYENIDHDVLRASLGIMVLLFILSFTGSFYNDTVSFWIVSTPIPSWILPLVSGVFLPFCYSGLTMMIGDSPERDEKMAESIDVLAEKNGHKQVLVLVGDQHVVPISDLLKQRGWEVESERSQHPIPRLIRSF